MRSRWLWLSVVCALLVGWGGGCLFNPQPEPPAAVDSAPPDGGSGGTGAANGAGGDAAEGGSQGAGGDWPSGLAAGADLGRDRYPVGSAGGGGGEGGQGPTGGAGGST